MGTEATPVKQAQRNDAEKKQKATNADHGSKRRTLKAAGSHAPKNAECKEKEARYDRERKEKEVSNEKSEANVSFISLRAHRGLTRIRRMFVIKGGERDYQTTGQSDNGI